VNERERLVLLLTPPFDTSLPSPGYIQGYPPGVRENGGQYTHAAMWAAMAYAALGDGERGWALFDLLNPLSHGATADQAATYKVEPYVADRVAARAAPARRSPAAGTIAAARLGRLRADVSAPQSDVRDPLPARRQR
jgi:cyclic beta-1,2-glucan synthetase